jgi:hypothetical protein
VTYLPIARQRLCKYIAAEGNAHNNRTSIVRQWISKEESLTIEAVFSAWPVQSGYKEVFGIIEQNRISCQELCHCLEMTVRNGREETARKELGSPEKSSCVI